jgi:hypothetical protein
VYTNYFIFSFVITLLHCSCVAFLYIFIAVASSPDSKRQKLEDGTNLMGRLLTKTFALLDDARPKVRAAASVLFLSFIKYAPRHVDVQSRMYDIQAACTRLLGERSEFVQEGNAFKFEKIENVVNIVHYTRL